jgi:hypothetical protein
MFIGACRALSATTRFQHYQVKCEWYSIDIASNIIITSSQFLDYQYECFHNIDSRVYFLETRAVKQHFGRGGRRSTALSKTDATQTLFAI